MHNWAIVNAATHPFTFAIDVYVPAVYYWNLNHQAGHEIGSGGCYIGAITGEI